VIARTAAPISFGLILCAAAGVLAATSLAVPAVGGLVVLGALVALWRYAHAPVAAIATLVVYAAYILFSRDFAELHVAVGPLPLYVGEMLLLVALPWALARLDVRRALTSPFFAALGAWMAFCALRLSAGGFDYGIEALRDSAVWYYGAFAAVGYALWRALPPTVWTPFFASVFGALPAVAIVGLSSEALDLPYRVPREDVLAAGLIASANFFLLALRTTRYTILRVLFSSLALVLLVPLEVRSATVGVVLLLGIFAFQRRWNMLASLITIPVVAFAFLAIANVPLSGRAGGTTASELLERQLTVITLLVEGGVISNDPTLPRDATSGTALWRYNWWIALTEDALSSPQQFLFGSGFGADITWPLGTNQSQFDRPLRSPHNVAMTMFARTGIVGLLLWLTMLATWLYAVVRSIELARRKHLHVASDFLLWMTTYVVLILTIAVLGVVLESPVGAVPLFLTMGMALCKAEEIAKVGPY